MDTPYVLIETSSGDILVELYPDKAPETVANFLQYVDDGFYRNTIFHRVIADFMIQGGGLTMTLAEKPTRPSIKNEADNGLKNAAGTLAMAREAAPHSAKAQFYINTVDNPELDFVEATNDGFGYCVFGQVTDGLEVVEKIGRTKTKAQGEHQNLPVDSVVITAVSRFEL